MRGGLASAVTQAREEAPRAVFLAACEALASRFESEGFRFAKSGPHCSRRRGEFTHEVAFASSRYNETGKRVGLTVYAAVWSNDLRKWRREQGVEHGTPGNRVAGGMLQNLSDAIGVAIWDVADSHSRPRVLRDVGNAIEAAALPYFELFVEGDALARRLEQQTLPCFYALDAIEWLLSHDEPGAALQHGRILLRDQDLRREYRRALKAARRGGAELVRWAPILEAEGLAYAAVAYGLDF